MLYRNCVEINASYVLGKSTRGDVIYKYYISIWRIRCTEESVFSKEFACKMRESTFYICIRFLDKSLNKFRLISIIIINPKTLRRIEFVNFEKRINERNEITLPLNNWKTIFSKNLSVDKLILSSIERMKNSRAENSNAETLELSNYKARDLKKKKNQKQRSPVNWFRKAIERGAKIISPPWKNKEQAARPAFT